MVTVRAHLLILVLINALGFSSNVEISRADDSPLDPVRQAIDEIRYEEASALLEQALGNGHLRAQSLADAYRLSGEVSAALGDLPRARERFTRWLTLDPEGQLPTGTSPKISSTFLEARAHLLTHGPLRVRHNVRRNQDTTQVELLVDADPLGMVHGIRVAYRVGEHDSLASTETRDSLRVVLDVSDQHWLHLQVLALDEHGNELLVLGEHAPFALAPATGGPASMPLVVNQPRRAWYAQWYTYTGVAVAAGGASLYFGLQSRADGQALSALNDKSAESTFAEARAIEEQGRRNAVLANVSLGAAGISTAAALICLWRGSSHKPRTVVAPTVARGGGGLTVKRTF